jgi:hypothetical protein
MKGLQALQTAETLSFSHRIFYDIQDDQTVSVLLMITVQKHAVCSNNPHQTYELKMAITECIRNVNRAKLHTDFENTVRRVNKCLETRGRHFKHYV